MLETKISETNQIITCCQSYEEKKKVKPLAKINLKKKKKRKKKKKTLINSTNLKARKK